MNLPAQKRGGMRLYRGNRDITESMARFAEEYVFGAALNSLAEYAKLIGVTKDTIYDYLRNENVRVYIMELRGQRLDMIQRSMQDKLGVALDEVEQIAKIDAQRVVNKGRKNEFRVYDPALLDRKLRAATQLIDFVSGAERSAADDQGVSKVDNGSIKDLRIQINNMPQANASSGGQSDNDLTLEQIEQLLREKEVLNRGERIKLISDVIPDADK